MKLVKISRSPNPEKKLRAYFDDGTHTDFGASGMKDYTIYYKEDGKQTADMRKMLYLSRHRKNENWSDYKSPGSLSRFILWNLPSVEASIADYKRRFNL